jgi:hypothetical protein
VSFAGVFPRGQHLGDVVRNFLYRYAPYTCGYEIKRTRSYMDCNFLYTHPTRPGMKLNGFGARIIEHESIPGS